MHHAKNRYPHNLENLLLQFQKTQCNICLQLGPQGCASSSPSERLRAQGKGGQQQQV